MKFFGEDVSLGDPKLQTGNGIAANQPTANEVVMGVDLSAINLPQLAARPDFTLKHYLINHELYFLDQIVNAFQKDLQARPDAKAIHLFIESSHTTLQGRKKEELALNSFISSVRKGELLADDPARYFPEAQEFRAHLQYQLGRILGNHPGSVAVHILDSGYRYDLKKIERARQEQEKLDEKIKDVIIAPPAVLESNNLPRSEIDVLLLVLARDIAHQYSVQINGNRNHLISSRAAQAAAGFAADEIGFVFTGAGHLGVTAELLQQVKTAYEYVTLPESVLSELPFSYRYSFTAAALEQAGVKILDGTRPELDDLRNIVGENILSFTFQYILGEPSNWPGQPHSDYLRTEVADFYASLVRRAFKDPQQLYQLVKTAVDDAYLNVRDRPLIEGILNHVIQNNPIGLELNPASPREFYRKIREQVFAGRLLV